MTATITPIKQDMVSIELVNGSIYAVPAASFMSWHKPMTNQMVPVAGLCTMDEGDNKETVYVPCPGVWINMSFIVEVRRIDDDQSST